MRNNIVAITSSENGSFGTGFVIDSDLKGCYVLTCQHVVDDVKTPIIENYMAKIITDKSFIDMVVLYVENLYLEPLSLEEDSCENLKVEVIGFSDFNKSVKQKEYIEATLYPEYIELHSHEDSTLFYNVRKIKAEDGFDFNRGNSGSPVFCKKSGNIIAMISNKEGNSIAYAIDIVNLKKVWGTMPSLIEKSKLKRKKRKISVVISILTFIIAIAILFIWNYNKNRVVPHVESMSIEEMNRDIRTDSMFHIFYGSDIEPKKLHNESSEYSDKKIEHIFFGIANISIPLSRRRSETKGSIFDKFIKGDTSYGDLKLKSIESLSKNTFLKRIDNELAHLEEEEKHIVVYLNSKNISFEQLAIMSISDSIDKDGVGLSIFFFSSLENRSLEEQNRFLDELSSLFGSNKISIIRF